MNFLAHGYRWLDRPYFLIGTAVPDWVAIADRSLRLRLNSLGSKYQDDGAIAELVRGILRHFQDDACFHSNATFIGLVAELTGRIQSLLDDGESLRPAFLAHLLTELLLDAAIAEEDFSLISRYYRVVAEVAPEEIERLVGQVAGRATDRLAPFIRRFLAAQVLWDYLDNTAILHRVNQVLRRVQLPTVPENFTGLLPLARRLVRDNRDNLLACLSDPAVSVKASV